MRKKKILPARASNPTGRACSVDSVTGNKLGSRFRSW